MPLRSGNFICIGYSESTDGLSDCNHGIEDGTIFKIDGNGNVLSKICIGGLNDDAFNDAISYSDSEIYVCGYTKSTDGLFSTNHGSWDGLIVKLDTSLNIKWQKNYGEHHKFCQKCLF